VRKLFDKIKIFKRPLSRKQVIYASLMVVGIFFAAAALRVILSDVFEDAAARNEYDQLRDSFPSVSGQIFDNEVPLGEAPDDADDFDAYKEEMDEVRELSLDDLARINRDFIGWISALDRIDYPVVRGSDNVKYVNTTFYGNRNSAGAIFMDYRHTKGFDEHVTILYGHRTRDGAMFTSLENYLDAEFRRRNPNISITTRDGKKLTYAVFAASLTDAWDAAYSIGFSDSSKVSEVFPNAPKNASRFLLLSTCTRGNNDDERILVFAAMK